MRRLVVWALGGLALGTLAAGVFAFAARPSSARKATVDTPFIEAWQTPPIYRVSGDPAELRFDISCLGPSGDAEGTAEECNGGGTAYVRTSPIGSWTSLPLQYDPNVTEGQYVATLPANIAAVNFQYYAVLQDNTWGLSTQLPAGGAAAPEWSYHMGCCPSAPNQTVNIGAHTFGSLTQPNARVASATWGSGTGQVGLYTAESGEQSGGTSFDVDSAHNVYILDGVNKRVLKFTSPTASTTISAADISGVGNEDLSVGSDGTLYILDPPWAADQSESVLRSYTPSGTLLSTAGTVDATEAVRIGGSTAYVDSYPATQWLPVMQNNGQTAVSKADQLLLADPARPSGQLNVSFERTGNDVRVGVTTATGVAERTVRIESTTDVAGVPLVDFTPGGNLVVTFAVYDDTHSEYEAVVISPAGSVIKQLALPSYDDVDSATQFRLVGTSVYEAGATTAGGVFVDRYDLGVS